VYSTVFCLNWFACIIIEFFERGLTKQKTCPYHKLVEIGQKKWLCSFRRKTTEYIISRVTHNRKRKSLLQDERPCEYAIFRTGFLEKEEKAL
jgi:hypothetical protein